MCVSSTLRSTVRGSKNSVEWQNRRLASLPRRSRSRRWRRRRATSGEQQNQSRNAHAAQLYNYAAVRVCIHTYVRQYIHTYVHTMPGTKGLKLCLKSRSVISCSPIAIISPQRLRDSRTAHLSTKEEAAHAHCYPIKFKGEPEPSLIPIKVELT